MEFIAGGMIYFKYLIKEKKKSQKKKLDFNKKIMCKVKNNKMSLKN
jgi:hypothetical protein